MCVFMYIAMYMCIYIAMYMYYINTYVDIVYMELLLLLVHTPGYYTLLAITHSWLVHTSG